MKNKRIRKVINFKDAIPCPKHEAEVIGHMAFSAVSPCEKPKKLLGAFTIS